MKHKIFAITLPILIFTFAACSAQMIKLTEDNLSIVNRTISWTESNSVVLSQKEGDGLAIVEGMNFESGTIEVDLKGENNPGRSFVGIAFNIQDNDTYEAIYFRPFNFQSDEKIRREHSVQYVSHPKHTWRVLRTDHEGEFEAEYARKPSPDDWISIRIEVGSDRVEVFDRSTDTKLLSVRRLEKQASNKIALWTGNNSKGSFRNLRIR